jgi:hypothetical protein
MWVQLLRIALVLAGGVAYAESTDESRSGLDDCFQVARIADEICSKGPDDPDQRVECFRMARAGQLSCLEHLMAEGSTVKGDTGSSSDRAQAAVPAKPLAQESTHQGQAATDSGLADQQASGSVPGERGDVRPRTSRNLDQAGNPSTQESRAGPVELQPPRLREEEPSRVEDWVVTGLIRSVSDTNDGPNVLGLRCRARRTEFLLRAEGGWSAPNGKELRVDFQINDQPVVHLPWIVSADGKTATYKHDPVEFLRSIPEGARVKVAATNKENIRREARFRLDGLSAIRQTVGTACNWAPGAAKTSDAVRR